MSSPSRTRGAQGVPPSAPTTPSHARRTGGTPSRAAYIVVAFNDDGSASMSEVYWVSHDEAARCVASHNRMMTNCRLGTFAVISTDPDETRRQLDQLFPRTETE